MPDFSIEQQYSGTVAGVDEAGRGPWAGPVVAAAVIFWRDGAALPDIPDGLDDSKKLSRASRESLYISITERFHYGVGIVDVSTIDRVNILQASWLAMQQAVRALASVPQLVLVDGPHTPEFSCAARPVIRGDGISLSIAAASIVAKVTRDRIMRELHGEYPHYGWASNAGYGTEGHQQGLLEHGVSPHHRRSFRPIRELLEEAAHA